MQKLTKDGGIDDESGGGTGYAQPIQPVAKLSIHQLHAAQMVPGQQQIQYGGAVGSSGQNANLPSAMNTGSQFGISLYGSQHPAHSGYPMNTSGTDLPPGGGMNVPGSQSKYDMMRSQQLIRNADGSLGPPLAAQYPSAAHGGAPYP